MRDLVQIWIFYKSVSPPPTPNLKKKYITDWNHISFKLFALETKSLFMAVWLNFPSLFFLLFLYRVSHEETKKLSGRVLLVKIKREKRLISRQSVTCCLFILFFSEIQKMPTLNDKQKHIAPPPPLYIEVSSDTKLRLLSHTLLLIAHLCAHGKLSIPSDSHQPNVQLLANYS